MKKVFLFIFTIVLSISLFSCKGNSEISNLHVCGSYAVPGMFHSDLKGHDVSVNILEKDSYNRVLFEYKTYNYISEKEDTAYIICQKYDSEYVYFYEDICYDFTNDETNHFKTLKEKNDWNQEFDLSKSSRRSNEITFDLTIKTTSKLSVNKVIAECRKSLNIHDSMIKDHCIVDCDGVGNTLYFLKVFDDIEKIYFVIADLDYNVSLMEITKDFSFFDLSQFKANNHWIYGY